MDDGHQELQLAQHYLEGPSRDSSAAAHWLWKSVSKQNATALLLLSNLYQTGDGVPKSCEQARLLLVAAAKKGNLDAAGQLRNFDSSTCR
jgi:TPR repeat protein